jgi:hypothetical protein
MQTDLAIYCWHMQVIDIQLLGLLFMGCINTSLLLHFFLSKYNANKNVYFCRVEPFYQTTKNSNFTYVPAPTPHVLPVYTEIKK